MNNKIIKTICEYLAIILVVIIIRLFIITPIEVNGHSMETTLYDKDIMILNILGYRTNDIKRFDIVVIKYQDEHIIKRIIGLPGETVKYIDNTLYVNDELTNDVIDDDTENFSTYEIKNDGIIPKDNYFVLGDNRDNSADSRVIGLINKKDIVGKTNLIIYPFKHFGFVK